MFWFNTKRRSKFFIILDVGSSVVTAAYVTQSGGGQIRLIFQAERTIETTERSDYSRFTREIKKAIESVLTAVQHSGLGPAQEVHAFLSSPFVISQTRTLTLHDQGGRPFTKKILDNLLRREQDSFLSLNNEDGSFRILENKLLKLKINGYEQKNPFGKPANEITLIQYLSGAPIDLINTVYDSVLKVVHNNQIKLHSYNYAAWEAISDLSGDKPNFMAIDTSGELTDIIVSTSGVFSEAISFPYATNSLFRDLARDHRTTVPLIKSQLSLLRKNALHETEANKLRKTLDLKKKIWIEQLDLTFKDLARSTIIPSTIYLLNDSDSHDIFSEWLSHKDLSRHNLSSINPEITEVHPSDLSRLYGSWGECKNPYVLMETSYLDKLLNSQE